MAIWPTKEKNTKFKYDSFYFQLSKEVQVIKRSTYSVLDWLGDVGGLYDGLKIIASFLIAPISSLAAKDLLLTQVFRVMPSQRAPINATSLDQSTKTRI